MQAMLYETIETYANQKMQRQGTRHGQIDLQFNTPPQRKSPKQLGCADEEVDELDDGKLDIMLRAKYGSVDQAQKILGAPEDIRQTFIDFQRELYA